MSELPTLSITLCLIVKNEEKHLENCLKSTFGIWQKLIITDTGSTDSTLEIAKKFNAEIFHFKWKDDFSAARNYTLQQVKSDWIFTLDADDILEQEDQESLQNKLPELTTKHDLLIMPYIYSGSKTNPLLTHYLPRFWKRNNLAQYTRSIHEYLITTSFHNPQYLSEPIIHNKQISHLGSINRNIELLKEAIKKDPNDLESIIYLGLEHEAKEDFFQAEKYFESYIQKKPEDLIRLCTAYTRLGIIKIRFSDYSKARKLLQKAISVGPEFIEAYLFLAELEMHTGSLHLAIALLEKAKNLTPPTKISVTNLHLYHGAADQLLTITKNKIRMQTV